MDTWRPQGLKRYHKIYQGKMWKIVKLWLSKFRHGVRWFLVNSAPWPPDLLNYILWSIRTLQMKFWWCVNFKIYSKNTVFLKNKLPAPPQPRDKSYPGIFTELFEYGILMGHNGVIKLYNNSEPYRWNFAVCSISNKREKTKYFFFKSAPLSPRENSYLKISQGFTNEILQHSDSQNIVMYQRFFNIVHGLQRKPKL